MTKFIPFHKIYTLRCGTCTFQIETPRRRLAQAIRGMKEHHDDRSDHAPFTRTDRIAFGLPE